jgi:hypothetical protein
MKVSDVMTSPAITVRPDAPTCLANVRRPNVYRAVV